MVIAISGSHTDSEFSDLDARVSSFQAKYHDVNCKAELHNNDSFSRTDGYINANSKSGEWHSSIQSAQASIRQRQEALRPHETLPIAHEKPETIAEKPTLAKSDDELKELGIDPQLTGKDLYDAILSKMTNSELGFNSKYDLDTTLIMALMTDLDDASHRMNTYSRTAAEDALKANEALSARATLENKLIAHFSASAESYRKERELKSQPTTELSLQIHSAEGRTGVNQTIIDRCATSATKLREIIRNL